MKLCKFCGKELPNNHLTYCRVHVEPCEVCGKEFTLDSRKVRERNIVCIPCNRKKNASLNKSYAQDGRIGFKRKDLQEAASAAFEKKYGVKNPSSVPSIQKKRKEIFQERYGSNSAFGAKEVKEKIAKTNIERYGAENPFASPAIQEKIRKGYRDTHGVDNPTQVPAIKKQQTDSLLKNHGVTSPLKSPAILAKQQKTMKDRHGVGNSSQIPRVRDENRKRLTLMGDEEFKVIVKSLAEESAEGKTTIQAVFARTPYESIGHAFKKIRNLGLQDYLEHGKDSSVNLQWKEILEYELGIELQLEGAIFENKRWKCDLYSAEHRIAIDINPTISHSTQKAHPFYLPKSTTYHQKRALAAEENGWLLYQIYDWTDQTSAIAQLKNLFGLNKRIYARKCSSVEIPKSVAVEFLETNHLQGSSAVGSIFYGLYHGDELVQVMTFSRGRFRGKKAQYELIRLASAGTGVGGPSKLFAAFVRNYAPESVLSYASLDIGHGKVYEKLGFTYSGLAALNALYSKPGTGEAYKVTTCSSKFGKIYQEAGMTQKEYMNSQGFYRINDSGSRIFIWCR